jgi:hypothetical protein
LRDAKATKQSRAASVILLPRLRRFARNDKTSAIRQRQTATEAGVTNLRTGGCLCGAIRYESGGKPVFSLQCHCRDCQRQSGSAFVAAVRVPSASFRIVKGEPKRYVARSDAGNEIARVFCGDCGAPLYVQVSTRPDLVGIRVASFDDPSWFRPDADIFVKSAQPWDYMNPDVPKFPTYPAGKAY